MALIQFDRGDGQYEIVEFDVLEAHGVKHTAKATQFPVETGSEISDHVLQDPDVVDLSGIVSNTPLPANVRLRELVNNQYVDFKSAAEGGQFTGRADVAYRSLLKAKEAAAFVEIQTPRNTYSNMVIENLSISETAATGDAFTFSISARKIRTTSTQTVAAPIVPDVAKPKVNKGRKPTKEATGRPMSMVKAGKITFFNAP